MLTKVFSAAVIGIEAEIVEVEVDIFSGLPAVIVVGLPDTAVKESKERVKSAIKHSNSVFPGSHIAINLAPADLPKNGTLYDLPIAVSILTNSGQLQCNVSDTVIVGELALDGMVRPVGGVLPIALSARKKGFSKIIVPKDNADEASLVPELEVLPAQSLTDVISHLQGVRVIPAYPKKNLLELLSDHSSLANMKDIRGQDHAKRALEIAAAGSHNVLMVGPPGSGKTLLARTFATILPKLSEEEMLEVTKIYSVSQSINSVKSLVTARPFRSPHHTASAASLVGGGSIPRPGEISLAHRGVLFLDELPEFNRTVLESLRQPLEDGVVTISRIAGVLAFPARFTLVAAQNPCPCGYFNDPLKNCTCSSGNVMRYNKKISGPLLDRIDLHVDVPRISYEKITAIEGAESSESIRERVEQARLVQRERFRKHGLKIQTNTEMGSKDIQMFCETDSAGQELLKSALTSMHLSARSYYRVLKVSRTIADLALSPVILSSHIAEAIQYRPRED